MSFSFDSVDYGLGCPGDVYGFAWCSVDMVLYLAVEIWLSSVSLGFGYQNVFVVHLTRFGLSIWVDH